MLCQLSSGNQAIYGTLAVISHRKIIMVQGGATVPGIAIQGTGAGTGPPAPTVSNATDLRLTANLGTGTGPAAGVQARITWAQPKPGTPKLVISAENAATALLAPYLINFSGTVVDIGFGTAPAASQATGTYVVGITDVTG